MLAPTNSALALLYIHPPSPTVWHSLIQGLRYRVLVALPGKVLFQTHLLYYHRLPSPCVTDANANLVYSMETQGGLEWLEKLGQGQNLELESPTFCSCDRALPLLSLC